MTRALSPAFLSFCSWGGQPARTPSHFHVQFFARPRGQNQPRIGKIVLFWPLMVITALHGCASVAVRLRVNLLKRLEDRQNATVQPKSTYPPVCAHACACACVNRRLHGCTVAPLYNIIYIQRDRYRNRCNRTATEAQPPRKPFKNGGFMRYV